MNPLDQLRVIVTGAASGIGRATAELLMARGARLLLADLKESAVDACIAQLSTSSAGQSMSPLPSATKDAQRAPSACSLPIGMACDVRSADDCDRMVELACEKLGGIDALVHCAGILRAPGSRPAPLHELDEREYDAVVGTNLKGTFLVNRAVLRVLVAQKAGQIINISSTSGRKGRPLDSLYSASKAGVIGLSESIAEEVRPFGVRVQVLLPDAVATPLWEQNGPLMGVPPGSLPAERVAEVIALCLSLPADTMLENLVVAPFRLRKARGRGHAES